MENRGKQGWVVVLTGARGDEGITEIERGGKKREKETKREKKIDHYIYRRQRKERERKKKRFLKLYT